MGKQLITISILFTFLVGPVQACEDKLETLEKFITYYHRKPAPERVPEMLDLLLKENLLDDPLIKSSRGRLNLAHAFGYMARGNQKLIRLYESRFAGTNKTGRAFLLDTLRICADDATRPQLEKWSNDPVYADQKENLEAVRTFLANSKRQLPRDRQAQTPADLDLLWADFLTTGEYPPVTRILDALDQPGNLREKIDARLKKERGNKKDLLEALRELKLLQPGTKDKLVAGDLELILLHDTKGRLRSGAINAAAVLGKQMLQLSDEELERGLLLQATASWSLQENLEQHPKLREHLKDHCRERPARSQDLVKKWLRIDQPKIVLDKESQQLQGTWQATAWEEDGDVDEPKVTAEIIKYVRWTFEDDELRTTKAFTISTEKETEVRGQGGTVILSYKIDATKNPKALATNTISPHEGMVGQAIYTIEEDVLRVCMSKGGELPKGFSGKQGTGCILVTLKKVPDR